MGKGYSTCRVIYIMFTLSLTHCISFWQNAADASSGWSEVNLLLLLGTVGHVLSLGASSFVEEEHQTWYFLINTLCLALSQETCRSYFLGDECEPQRHSHVEQQCVNLLACPLQDSTSYNTPESGTAGKRVSLLEAQGSCKWWTVLASPWLVLLCCRLLRSLNQTGVQGAHRPDFSHWLTR